MDIRELIQKEEACGVYWGPFRIEYELRRAPTHVRKQLERAKQFPQVYCARVAKDAPQTQELNPTSFSPCTTTAETNLWVPAVWTPIAANEPMAGSCFKVSFGGIYSNRTTSSPTTTFTPRWGQSATPANNVSLGASRAVYSGAATSGVPFYGEFTLTIRTVGSSGTAIGFGFVYRSLAGTGIMQPMGGTSATIDTTTAQGLIVGAAWSAANASNTLTCQWVQLKSYC